MNYHNYLQEISKLENKKKTKGWKKIKIMVFRNFTVEPVLNVIKVELMKKDSSYISSFKLQRLFNSFSK